MTFVSSDICSVTQTIPLEILAEPLKVPDEPLLKTEDKPQPSQEKPSTETVEEKPQENTSSKSSPEIRVQTPSTEAENDIEDDAEELALKTKDKSSELNISTNALAPHGSTLSLDKDGMSIDSLDISNDRRQIPNNN